MVRLITFELSNGNRRIGALVENDTFVVDLTTHDPTIPTSMREFLKGGQKMLQAAKNVIQR
jgi:hypothetical protein